MKTTNERIARTEAALAALKEIASKMPDGLQQSNIVVSSYGGRLVINASLPGVLKTALNHFGRNGWTVTGSDESGISTERKEPNGVALVIENIPSSTPAIGSDATPYLQ